MRRKIISVFVSLLPVILVGTALHGEGAVAEVDNGGALKGACKVNGHVLKIAHRGASGYCPENTLAAFRRAVELGADMIELDVHLTGDWKVAVIHDATVDRTTGDSGRVSEMTLERIQKLDAGNGERIPSLDQVLKQVGSRCCVNVELKGQGAAAPVAEILDRFVRGTGVPWENFVVSSFDHAQLAALRKIEPRLRLAPLFEKELPEDFVRIAHGLSAWSVNLNSESVTPEIVERCHREGILVLVYTVNEAGEIAKMKRMGVDGIIGNYPDRL